MDDATTAKFGTNCLLARRLVERGVRFVQLYCGTGSGWDAHIDLEEQPLARCAESPTSRSPGCSTDLKARGLLDDTLVVWGGEFGRTPFNEKGNGRDHNPWGFTMWMAGGGVKGGADHRHHRRDRPARRRAPCPRPRHPRHDSASAGPEPRELTYLHNGRAERPTVNAGEVVKEILAHRVCPVAWSPSCSHS